MKIRENMHVLLLKGGFGSEREVSLNSAKACSKAIKENGFIVTEVDIAKMNVNNLISLKADVCFNALHGNSGENGSIQGLLNLLKIPYTHSGVAASAISMNKIYFKRLIVNTTESTYDPIIFPRTLQINEGEKLSIKNYNGLYVLKPKSGGSSVGVKIVKGQNDIPFKNEFMWKDLMAEEFVGSMELTVTVLKDKPLCVTEIIAGQNEEFYNYRAKYERNGSIHEIPAKIPRQLYEQAMSWALRAHKIVGCKGISRSDFRYDKINDQLYMLEINTQPGMTETSLSPEQALFCNISLSEMVKIIIEEACYEC
ncbi:MAG: D-alanine--D-alanine ligase [Candidatus Puniceispirillales bacterium]